VQPAAAVDQHEVAGAQRARLLGAVREGRVRAEQHERSSPNPEAPVGRRAPARGLRGAHALPERLEHRPVGPHADLGRAAHQGELVGVFHHAAPRRHGSRAREAQGGGRLRDPVRKGEGHRLLDSDPPAGSVLLEGLRHHGVGRFVLLPGAHVRAHVDLLVGAVAFEGRCDPDRVTVAPEHEAEEALGETPLGAAEITQARAGAHHDPVEARLRE
jgi:hypothetical protein